MADKIKYKPLTVDDIHLLFAMFDDPVDFARAIEREIIKRNKKPWKPLNKKERIAIFVEYDSHLKIIDAVNKKLREKNR